MKSKITQISWVPSDLNRWLNSSVLLNESDGWIMGQIIIFQPSNQISVFSAVNLS